MSAHVYRCYDVAGQLLYVGCTNDVKARMSQHRYKSTWAGEIDRVESHEYPERWQAQCVEQFLISLLRPSMNKVRPWVSDAYTLRKQYKPGVDVTSLSPITETEEEAS
jgi:hypothetical protein